LIGKLIGVLFGLLLLGPISPMLGILLGLYVGHRFDRSVKQFFYTSFDEQPVSENKPYVEAVFSVMGHLLKADGRVSEREIRYAEEVMDSLKLTSSMRRFAIDSFALGKSESFNINQSLTKLKLHFFINPRLLQRFIEIQLQAARVDGAINKKQKEILDYIAQNLGFQPFFSQNTYRQSSYHGQHQQHNWQRQQRSFHTHAEGMTLDKAYRILGVKADVDQKGLKKAYRQQIGRHHPDRIMAKNAGDDAIKKANEATQDIQKAYAFISRSRGYKGFS
jgi:DnaJ like chaperone protein